MKIIVGMHRSGTSLLAGFLNKSGGDFGDPDTFHPADKWNPGGYFEQKEIIAINKKLLHGAFNKLSYIALPTNQTILKRGTIISNELSRLVERYNGKIVKENRFCLTLPAWQMSGLKLSSIVICLRNPWDVVQSIWERNHVPHFLGFQLWLKHLTRILSNTVDIPRCYFSYEYAIDVNTRHRELCNVLDFLSIPYDAEEVDVLAKKMIKMPDVENFAFKRKLPSKIEYLWQELMTKHNSQFAR
jgi:hypothetical protein